MGIHKPHPMNVARMQPGVHLDASCVYGNGAWVDGNGYSATAARSALYNRRSEVTFPHSVVSSDGITNLSTFRMSQTGETERYSRTSTKVNRLGGIHKTTLEGNGKYGTGI